MAMHTKFYQFLIIGLLGYVIKKLNLHNSHMINKKYKFHLLDNYLNLSEKFQKEQSMASLKLFDMFQIVKV